MLNLQTPCDPPSMLAVQIERCCKPKRNAPVIQIPPMFKERGNEAVGYPLDLLPAECVCAAADLSLDKGEVSKFLV